MRAVCGLLLMLLKLQLCHCGQLTARWVLYTDENRTWSAASHFCHQQDGFLSTPRTARTQQALKLFAFESISSTDLQDGDGDFWLGLFAPQPGLPDYRWERLNRSLGGDDTTDWSDTEPNDLQTDLCVRWSLTGWSTRNCSMQYHVVCHFPDDCAYQVFLHHGVHNTAYTSSRAEVQPGLKECRESCVGARDGAMQCVGVLFSDMQTSSPDYTNCRLLFHTSLLTYNDSASFPLDIYNTDDTTALRTCLSDNCAFQVFPHKGVHNAAYTSRAEHYTLSLEECQEACVWAMDGAMGCVGVVLRDIVQIASITIKKCYLLFHTSLLTYNDSANFPLDIYDTGNTAALRTCLSGNVTTPAGVNDTTAVTTKTTSTASDTPRAVDQQTTTGESIQQTTQEPTVESIQQTTQEPTVESIQQTTEESTVEWIQQTTAMPTTTIISTPQTAEESTVESIQQTTAMPITAVMTPQTTEESTVESIQQTTTMPTQSVPKPGPATSTSGPVNTPTAASVKERPKLCPCRCRKGRSPPTGAGVELPPVIAPKDTRRYQRRLESTWTEWSAPSGLITSSMLSVIAALFVAIVVSDVRAMWRHFRGRLHQ